MDLITYRANFPAVPTGTDITSQLFDVSTNGVSGGTQALTKEATSAEFEVPQNANVDLRLIYVDDAGNHSQPRLQSFVAVDTIAPDAPGEFGSIDVISERTVPDA